METTLERSELLQGLDEDLCARLRAIARTQRLDTGGYLFLLGDAASQLYVVLEGRLDVCFPFSIGGAMSDIAVESILPGSALGWSAFVKPHRFTLSARAAEPSAVAAFPRDELDNLLQQDCRRGLAFTRRITELVGARLVKMRALWARELQRSLPGGKAPRTEGGFGAHPSGSARA